MESKYVFILTFYVVKGLVDEWGKGRQAFGCKLPSSGLANFFSSPVSTDHHDCFKILLFFL